MRNPSGVASKGGFFRISAMLALASTLVLGSTSHSVAAAPSGGAELEAWRKVHRYEAKFPNSDMNAGGARVNVNAPTSVLRSVVLDFKNYSSFIDRFEKSRVVGKSGDKTDVYLEVPILKGAAKVWAIVRFEAPKTVGQDEVIIGRMIKGNVKRLDANWRIKKLDDTTSKLECELLIVPDLPVPNSLIVGELRFAAAKAVGGSRNEAEKRNRPR